MMTRQFYFTFRLSKRSFCVETKMLLTAWHYNYDVFHTYSVVATALYWVISTVYNVIPAECSSLWTKVRNTYGLRTRGTVGGA